MSAYEIKICAMEKKKEKKTWKFKCFDYESNNAKITQSQSA